uniref:RNA-directed RNA polymerase C-terminal domain-containing protein n=1 Tax=Riboviria sp. TaxID=2585031 RepID=A0A8K1U3Q5_9VIRU|nr:MAG: hypothetical protein 3 [Riboviria sp.]
MRPGRFFRLGFQYVGQRSRLPRPTDRPTVNSLIAANLDAFRSAGEYEILTVPHFKTSESASVEQRSFIASQEIREEYPVTAPPTAVERRQLLDHLEEKFSVMRTVVPEDFLSFEKFLEVVSCLNFQASPGLPYCRQYPTIADFLGWDGMTFQMERAQELYAHVMYVVKHRVADPFRVFIKQEPLPAAKVQQGRWRLIFSCPLVLQVLDHLLFKDQNQKELEEMLRLPTKIGWTPFYGMAELVVRDITDPYSMDKSAWDHLFPAWCVDLDKDFRQSLAFAPPLWHDLVDWRYRTSFQECELRFSDGSQYRQLFKGFMKSGLVNTLTTNSHAQYFMYWVACRRSGVPPTPGVIIGDDQLAEGMMENAISLYREMGCKIKQLDRNYHFAGFDLASKTPLYWSKHVTNLLYTDNLAETLEAYQMLYAFHPVKFGIMQQLLAQVEPARLKTARYLRSKLT